MPSPMVILPVLGPNTLTYDRPAHTPNHDRATETSTPALPSAFETDLRLALAAVNTLPEMRERSAQSLPLPALDAQDQEGARDPEATVAPSEVAVAPSEVASNGIGNRPAWPLPTGVDLLKTLMSTRAYVAGETNVVKETMPAVPVTGETLGRKLF